MSFIRSTSLNKTPVLVDIFEKVFFEILFFDFFLPFPSPSSSLFELIEHIFVSNLESVESCECGNSKSETSGSVGIGDCHNGDFGKYSSF